MKVEGWKFIFRFNLWSCCLMMGWVMWLLYSNLHICIHRFGPWTQREQPSVFRYNFLYTGSRRILLLQKGNRQGAQWMCIEAENHKLLPKQDRTLSKLSSFSQLGQQEMSFKAAHLSATTVCWILSGVCWVESWPTQKGRPRDHSGHWSLKMYKPEVFIL